MEDGGVGREHLLLCRLWINSYNSHQSRPKRGQVVELELSGRDEIQIWFSGFRAKCEGDDGSVTYKVIAHL